MAFTKTAGVEYGVPATTLSTTAAEGSNQTAIRTDAQLIAFNTDSPAAVASSGAVGVSPQASRADHAHSGYTVAKTEVIESTRTASAGSGDQSFTSFGFTPVGAIMIQTKDGGSNNLSIGLANGDDSGYIAWVNGSSISNQTNEFSRTDGNPNMTCTLKSLDSDGLTLTWIKYGSPSFDVEFGIIAFG